MLPAARSSREGRVGIAAVADPPTAKRARAEARPADDAREPEVAAGF